jgi:hypothetical protein
LSSIRVDAVLNKIILSIRDVVLDKYNNADLRGSSGTYFSFLSCLHVVDGRRSNCKTSLVMLAKHQSAIIMPMHGRRTFNTLASSDIFSYSNASSNQRKESKATRRLS